MTKLLLWLRLFVISWPLALLVLVLYPLIWLIMLPFRLAGIRVKIVFELMHAVITLPFKLIKKI